MSCEASTLKHESSWAHTLQRIATFPSCLQVTLHVCSKLDELGVSAAVLLLMTRAEGHAAMQSMQQLAVSDCETETVHDASSTL